MLLRNGKEMASNATSICYLDRLVGKILELQQEFFHCIRQTLTSASCKRQFANNTTSLEAFARRCFTQTNLSRGLDNQVLLRAHTRAQTSLLYREPLCAQMPLHTGQLLHTEAFMPRCLHIPRSLDAQMLLHKDIAYAQMLLIRESFDTEAFTHRCFDTEKAFTHRRFYTKVP